MSENTPSAGPARRPPPRIAIGSFMLESNAHAPVSTRAEFAENVLIEPEDLLADLATEHPRAPGGLVGFHRALPAHGRFELVPMITAAVGASGPIEQAWFETILASFERSLEQALRGGGLDGVYLCLHGAAIATVDADPDGRLLELVRATLGESIPVAVSLDLHGNISAAMVGAGDYFAAYLTNPHIDQHERGAECAAALAAMIAGGKRPWRAFVKLPFIPPSVTQNTRSGPYADAIAAGQRLVQGAVRNVSLLSGFTLGDTPKAGMSVIVSGDTEAAVASAAFVTASAAWADRERYVPRLTALDEATRLAGAVGADAGRPPLLFADVADNAGGGGRGNTVWILEAFHLAGVRGCALGVFYDAALAREAHALGIGARFHARFNRDETHPLSGRFAADVTVGALHDGRFVGRRGISAGHAIDLGPCARLDTGGIQIVVISIRQQAKDPVFFEALGIDIAGLRSLVVKSRGHFRAAFDEFFPDERIVEVDVPGLTTPVLANVPFRHLVRPLYPLDADWGWTVPAPQVFAARRRVAAERPAGVRPAGSTRQR